MSLSAAASVAVVCPPLTIWRSVTCVSRSPSAPAATVAAAAVAAIPLLYAKNIVGSVETVLRIALLMRPTRAEKRSDVAFE